MRERRGHERADRLFVLDHQERIEYARRRLSLRRLCRLARRGGRKVQPEGCAVARLAVHEDEAAALFHRPIDHRETEAGPLADLFRREERLEDVRLRFGAHAVPGIGDAQRDVRARRHRHAWARRVVAHTMDRGGED